MRKRASVRIFFFVLVASSQGVGAAVSVRVAMSCGDVKAAPCADGSNAYVALVSPDNLPRKPTAEAIAKAGGAELKVPAGPYVLVAVARGYSLTIQPVSVTESAGQQVNVRLRKNRMLTGRIIDAEGRPVPSATVERAGLDAPAAISELSPLGMSTLRDNGSARTDDTGRWSLDWPGTSKVPLAVHAPGYAEALISIGRHPAGDIALPPTVLEKASRLTVELDRTDEEMIIIPRASVPSPIQADWLDRWRAKTATARAVEWSSLAPGNYGLYAVNTNSLKFQAPVKLTTVQLGTPGEQTRVKVSLPQPRSVKSAYIKLLIPSMADSASLKAYEEANVGNAPVEIAFAEDDAIGGRVVYLDTAAAPERTYLTTSREILLPRSGSRIGEALMVESLPRATLSFRLVGPAGTKLPASVRSSFPVCVKDEHHARPLSFAVSKTGEVVMAVPSACRAAVIEPGDYAPIATAFLLKPTETLALGEFRLSRSGRAEVHVYRQPSGAIANDVLVRARVMRGTTFVPLEPVKTGADGVAHLEGLPPDQDLIIEAYKAGSELKGSAPLRLDPGQSVVVSHLDIPEAGSLSITASLNDDFQRSFPSASLDALHLNRIQKDDQQPPDTRDMRLDSNKSTVEFSDLTPGSWGIQLLVRVAGSLQTIDTDPVDIQSGKREEVERTAKPVVIDGVVMERKQGIEALIEVRDWPDTPGALARPFTSKSDGSFRMVLPREGTYDIDVRKKIRDSAPIVLGTRALASGQRLELSLPMNAVVVTTMADGKPAPNALVLLKRRIYAEDGGVSQLTLQDRTSEQGEAIFDSVLEGPWIVEASLDPERPVTQRSLTVDPALPVVEVTLDLDEEARLKGHVFTASGAVAVGGAVDCVYIAQDLIVRSARSLVLQDGSYTMKFAKPVPQNLSCGVTTPDGAILPFSATPGTQDLFMPPEAGALKINDFGKMIVADRFWLVSGDQIFDLTWAARAMGSRWQPLALSRVPAGRWRLVRAPSPDLFAVVQAHRGIDVVSDLEIAPGRLSTTNILPEKAAAP
jgi:hypothetical protein